MSTILTNAFSINMLNSSSKLEFIKINASTAARININRNAIGHPDTDRVVRNILERKIDFISLDIPEGERSNVSLEDEGDKLVVAQYHGPRLPEGATTLPEGATIQFWVVQFTPPSFEDLESLWGEKIISTESGETDVGGFPISGKSCLESGKVIGSWGPTTLENWISNPYDDWWFT